MIASVCVFPTLPIALLLIVLAYLATDGFRNRIMTLWLCAGLIMGAITVATINYFKTHPQEQEAK